MMTQRNGDVRKVIGQARKRGVKQWMIAERYGLSEGNFCRLLRRELSSEEKSHIFAVIKELQNDCSKKELVEAV